MDLNEDRSDHQTKVEAWVDNKISSLRQPIEWEPNAELGWTLLRRGQRSSAARLQTALVSIAALVVAGGLLTFPQSRVLAERCVDACVAGSNGLGQLFGIGTKVGPSIAGRMAASPFRLPNSAGKEIDLSAFRGQVVVLNFWATWCEPCKVEIPWFIEFNARFHDRGFAVVGISMDDGGWTTVVPYLRTHAVNYPVVLGGDELSKEYGGVEALPSTFLLDKAGNIAFIHTGLVSKATYENEIMRLIAEKDKDQ